MKKIAFLLLALVLAMPAMAEVPESPAREAILIDVDTNTTLYEKNADMRMPTASMSKVMTGYMVFEALKSGRLTLDTKVPVSERAWRMEGSRTFLDLGSLVRVEDLIKGMVIQSGNDAAVTLAEAVGGTEEGFAAMATQRARELGMTGSSLANATGMPDPNHYSTARDLATLAIHVIREYPEYYKYDSEKEFTYHNIRQANRNPLLFMNIGADGVKTGHTEESGFGLIGSAVQNGRRLLIVINGLPDEKSRADEAARLMQWGFANTSSFKLVSAGQVIDNAAVWLGKAESVPLVSKEDILFSISYETRRNLKAEVVVTEPVPAPITVGQQIATLRITGANTGVKEFPLYAQNDVPQLGFFGRLSAKAHHFILGD